MRDKHPQGQLLIEVLLALGIFVIISSAVTVLAIDAARFTTNNAILTEALTKGREANVAVYDLWRNDFSLLTVGTHGLDLQNQNQWVLTGAPDTDGKLLRTMTISDALRNPSGELSLLGAPDTQTKKVVTIISNIETNKILFSDVQYFPSVGTATPIPLLSWLQTTINDFRAGNFINTQRTNTNGGEVTLRTNRTTGTFTSSIFNSGDNATTYTRLVWNGTYEVLADMRIQIRVGRTAALINSANWFGPDGTTNTYFDQDDPIVLPATTSSPRRIQYRVEFRKSGTIVPILEDVEIWYAQ